MGPLHALGRLLGGAAHYAENYPQHAINNLSRLGKQVSPLDHGQSWGNPNGQPQINIRPVPLTTTPAAPTQSRDGRFFSVNGVNYMGHPRPAAILSPYWSPNTSYALPLYQPPYPNLESLRKL